MPLLFQLETVTAVLPSVTEPCVDPKFDPVIVTDVPGLPEAGKTLVIHGPPVTTAKQTPLLASLGTFTTTLPVVAPLGTGAEILVLLQLVGVAAVQLKLRVLLPCVAPKLLPAIVTAVPAGPEVGDRLLMTGAAVEPVTVNATPLLAWPPTVTTTFPVVAPAGTGALILVGVQLTGIAATPLKVTLLLP